MTASDWIAFAGVLLLVVLPLIGLVWTMLAARLKQVDANVRDIWASVKTLEGDLTNHERFTTGQFQRKDELANLLGLMIDPIKVEQAHQRNALLSLGNKLDNLTQAILRRLEIPAVEIHQHER